MNRYPNTAKSLPVVTITQLLLANLGAVLEGSETGLPLSLPSVDSRCANVLHLALRLGECLHAALAGGGGEAGGGAGDEGGDSDSPGWEGLLLLLHLLGNENEQRRRMTVIALGLVVACLYFLRTNARQSETLHAPDKQTPASTAMEEDASGEEEELLAGGGGDQDLLASGGASTSLPQVEVLGGGGSSGGGDMHCEGAWLEPTHTGSVLEASQHREMWLFTRIKAVSADSNEVNAAARELVGVYSKQEGEVRRLWLQRLVGLHGLPANVLDTLVLKLRAALKTETEVELLLQYLQYLAKVPGVAGTALAKDVAQLVLRRRVLSQHLSSLPGATAALMRILHLGLTSSASSGEDGQRASADWEGEDDMLEEQLVKVPGSSVLVPLVVVRAGLQSLCLDIAGAGSRDDEAERRELIKVLLPKKGPLPGPALSDEEMACLLQSEHPQISQCAVASATEEQLVAALHLCGATPQCLASIVARLKSIAANQAQPIASKLSRGMGARAVGMLKDQYPKEAQTLASMLGISMTTAPKKLQGPSVARLLPSQGQSFDLSGGDSTPMPQKCAHADAAWHYNAAASATRPPGEEASAHARGACLVMVPVDTLVAELVASEGASQAGGNNATVSGEGVGASRHGGLRTASHRAWPWQSVVKGLVEREGPRREEGLRMDFLSAVNPLLWSRAEAAAGAAASECEETEAAWKQVDAAVMLRVFGMQCRGEQDGVGGKGRHGPSCHASLTGPLLEAGGVGWGQSLQLCRQWLLRSAELDVSRGSMYAKPHSAIGADSAGIQLDCRLCLQFLSSCITGESGPIEGTWGEGGSGEVSETKTRRENMGLALRDSAMRRASASSAAECVSLAQYIVCEGSSLGGRVAMGRIHLLLLLIDEDQQATLAVSRALLSLVALTRQAGAATDISSSGRGARGAGAGRVLGVAERIALAAADMHERIRLAIPLLMASTPVASPAHAHGGEHDAWAVPWGEQHGGGGVRQTGARPRPPSRQRLGSGACITNWHNSHTDLGAFLLVGSESGSPASSHHHGITG